MSERARSDESRCDVVNGEGRRCYGSLVHSPPHVFWLPDPVTGERLPRLSEASCIGSCDHCRPDDWHGCARPRGHSGYHSCQVELGDFDLPAAGEVNPE